MTTTLAFALRPAAPADAGFELQLYASTRSELLPLGQEVFDGLVGAQFRVHTASVEREHPNADRQIVVVGETPVGRLVVDFTGEYVEVIDVALLPAARRHGVGTAVLGQVLADADRARRTARLHVERSNPATRLFERLGFNDDGGTALYRTMTRPLAG
jgi:ribosomal protein S18 acetylase RimI-like enzyme